MTTFKNLRFGFASAEMESAEDPDLLRDGYYEFRNAISEAIDGSRFLFLGYKGSGKSAIAEKLKLTASTRYDLFVTSMFLSDFPFTSFKKIVSGDAEPEARYPTAWSWILLLTLIDSFTKDEGGSFVGDFDCMRPIKELRSMGFLPTPSLKELVTVSSKRSFKTGIPKILEAGSETTQCELDLSLFRLVAYLKRLVQTFNTRSRHVLVIDGLDDILTARDVQYQSLAALVLEVARLNHDFGQNSIRAKIILLCRTDLFERLPGANKNKVRQDSAVQLDWYHNPRDPGTSELVRLANLRASLTDESIQNVISSFFPPTILDQSTTNFLLDLTRHTPRDFLQLLTHIQKFSSGGKLKREDILAGVRAYSIDYFLPELKDELVGYVSHNVVDSVFEAIGALAKRDFVLRELQQQIEHHKGFSDEQLEVALRALFECSAIGNIQHRPGNKGATFFSFKYRNRNSHLNMRQQMILHRGVWKAMNLI